jgi:hypothetical protein
VLWCLGKDLCPWSPVKARWVTLSRWARMKSWTLPTLSPGPSQWPPWLLRALSIVGLVAACLLASSYKIPGLQSDAHSLVAAHADPIVFAPPPACVQVDPLVPPAHDAHDAQLHSILNSAEFAHSAARILSGAVQIKTESYDDNGPVGTDPRWHIFELFADYLRGSFPIVHKHLDLQKVNTHALLYTWKGTDPSLKPLLLLAHQVSPKVPNAPRPLAECSNSVSLALRVLARACFWSLTTCSCP